MNRKTACKTCPFKKGSTPPGNIGGSSPLVYIGQSMGPFILPCHNSKGYAGKQTDFTLPTIVQCAGAAIFRSNIDVAKYMPLALYKLPEDKEDVFGSKEEFLAHYYQVSVEVIKGTVKDRDYVAMLQKELHDPRIKVDIFKDER